MEAYEREASPYYSNDQSSKNAYTRPLFIAKVSYKIGVNFEFVCNLSTLYYTNTYRFLFIIIFCGK